MKNIVIIHGLGGLKETYFPHLAETCKKLGLEVIMQNFGSYRENTNYTKWHNQFDENILNKIGNETIVVANSLGTQFIVKYLAEKKLEVNTYISVAGASKILDLKPTAPERVINAKPVSATFEPTEDEFEIFKNLNFKKYSFYSDNDRFFELSNLENYCNLIGSQKMFIPNKNHFDQDDETKIPLTEFAELENLISKLAK